MGSSSTASALVERSSEDSTAPEARVDSGRSARLARAFLLAIGVAFVLAVIAGQGLGDDTGTGPRLGGDYPAFHGAGSIVLDGDFGDLYDADRQLVEQRDLGIDGYLAFAYPPHVAVVYAPLAALGFRLGYVVNTVVMVAALVAAVRLVPVPVLRGRAWQTTALAIGFWPLFRAIGGGQNTAITVLVFAAVWRFLDEDRDVAAGVTAAALLYRPQYALPLVGVMALDRRWRAVAAATAVGALTWSVTALFMGAGWLTSWIDQALPFVERDAEVNAANSISLLGFSQAVLGADDRFAIALGATGALAVAGFLAWMWLHGERFPLSARMGALAAGVLLLSPHAMFYDAGLLVVWGAALLAMPASSERRRQVLVGIGVVWALGFLQLMSSTLGASPLALVVIAVFAIGAHNAFNSASSVSSEAAHA